MERFANGTEVNGTLVNLIIEGLGAFRNIASELLLSGGVNDEQSDHETYYSLAIFLKIFEHIEQQLGKATLYQLGTLIPQKAVFPPEVDDIEQALSAIDVAYHMNHRTADGEIMFDPNRTPPILEGIGHYHCNLIPNERKAVMVCDNPYPCHFDRGIIWEMAHRFRPKTSIVRIDHDKDTRCREEGGESCNYYVTW